MAHQSHVLPWNTVASHLKYVPGPPHLPLGVASITPRDKPTQSKELHHFARVFSAQIAEFGITERTKHRSKSELESRAATWLESSQVPELGSPSESLPDLPSPRKKLSVRSKAPQGPERRVIYRSELETKYDVRLSFQNIQSWILAAKGSDSNPQGGYNTSHGDLADIVKVLMTEAALLSSQSSPPSNPLTSTISPQSQSQTTETLLLLAAHPLVPLLDLRSLSWGHHFGFGRVAESAVTAYLFFGVLVALLDGGMPLLEEVEDVSLPGAPRRKNYSATGNWKSCMDALCSGGDYDEQTWVHRQVLLERGGEGVRRGTREGYTEILEDLTGLRSYMMVLWRLMVVFDVVVREARGDPKWEEEVVNALKYRFGFRTKWDMDKRTEIFI